MNYPLRSMPEHRRGWFTLDRELGIFTIMNVLTEIEFIPIEVTHGVKQTRYEGYSTKFDVIDEEELTPEYSVKVQVIPNNVIVYTERVTD